MTHLEMVNRLLRRLREDPVTTVAENAYSQLIGQFVADAYELLQDDWEWEALRHRIVVDLVSGQYVYKISDSVSGTGDVRTGYRLPTDESSLLFMEGCPQAWIYRDDADDGPETVLTFMTPEAFRQRRAIDRDQDESYPYYFTINPQISADEVEIVAQVFPEPTQASVLELMFYTPAGRLEVDGTTDSTQILLPHQPLYRLALMDALNERGEEIGEPGNIAERNFLNALGMAKEREVNMYGQAERYDWRRV